MAADARRPPRVGLQLPRHGLRRLYDRRADARPVAVRARRRWEPQLSDDGDTRAELHGVGRARALPGGKETLAVARFGPRRRPGFRSVRQVAGPVRRQRAADARRLRGAARRNQHARHSADALAGRHGRVARGRCPAEPREGDCDRRAAGAADPERGQREAGLQPDRRRGRRGHDLGCRQQPGHVRPADQRSQRAADDARGAGAVTRQGAVLRAAGAGAPAQEPGAHPGALPVNGRKLPPLVRPLPRQVAQSGGRQDAGTSNPKAPASRATAM